MGAHKPGGGPLHGLFIQGLGYPVGEFSIEGVIHRPVADAVTVGFGVGGVPGVEILRHLLGLHHPHIGGQVGVEGQRQAAQRHGPIITETERETARMNACVGAGTPLYIGAGPQHRFHGVLQHFADSQSVRLYLKPGVPGALVSQPQKYGHGRYPQNSRVVDRMMPSSTVRARAHCTSSLPKCSTFSRVRPSPPW